MSGKKVIAVLGATGNQGGSLIKAILAEGKKSNYVARAITRGGAKAEQLKKLGAQVVVADVNNADSLAKAVEGAHGFFCVSFVDFGARPETETASIKTFAEVAKKVGVKHTVWSTIEDTRKHGAMENKAMPILFDKYKVPHFDAKGEADHYFADLKVPTTYLLTSFFWENFTTMMTPQKGPDGKYYIHLCMGKKPLAGISTEDIGKCAFNIFKRQNDFVNKRVGIAGDHLPLAKMAEKMSKALDKQIVYQEMSFDAFRHLPFPGAEDLGSMFQFYHDHDKVFLGARSVEETRKLNPELLNFDQWLAKHKKNFKLA